MGYWTFIPPKEFDYQLLKNGKNFLDNHLGTEIFAFLSYAPFSELVFYIAYAIFSPGARYNEDNSGFSNKFDQLYIGDNKNYNQQDKFNLVYLLNTGFEYYF